MVTDTPNWTMKVLSAIGETKKGFKCLNGRILKNLDYVKNGHDNCGDNSDEKSKFAINVTQSSYSGLQKNWTLWERGKTFPLF